MKKPAKEVILGVTGGIAAYKSCDIIRKLRKSGFNVTVIMTEEARHFITPLTLQTISRNKVYSDMFELPSDWEPEHIALAKMADLVLIAPCSANIIGKLANGICDDLLTCTVISTKAKIVLAPAMNERMYKNRVVQENIIRLERLGYKFVGPVKGELACGEEGIGHLADADSIVREVKSLPK